MNSKLKTILIILAVGLVLVLAYVFIIKQPASTPTLTTSSGSGPIEVSTTATNPTTDATMALSKDFLNTLLSIKSIKLDDSIFSDPTFLSLHDSSIVLTEDTTAGRHDPFAPIGSDINSSQLGVTMTNGLNVVQDNTTQNPNGTLPPAFPNTTTPAGAISSGGQTTVIPKN